jgi:streptogramin lyase
MVTICSRRLILIRKGDRLIWTDPKTGKESKVTAAAGESDGLVVIKQNGALWPCPVDQVRRLKRAAPARGK